MKKQTDCKLINQNRRSGELVYMNYIDSSGCMNIDAQVTINNHNPLTFIVTYRGKYSHGEVRTITTDNIDYLSIKYGPALST